MEGLVVYEANEPATFSIPTHCYHAVITFELAAHSGCRVVGSFAEPQLEKATKWIRAHMLQPSYPRERMDFEVKEYLSDVAMWQRWRPRDKAKESIFRHIERATRDIKSYYKKRKP